MHNTPLVLLFVVLILLIIVSAFFAGSETGLMAINRYRLRHRAQSGHRPSQVAFGLLQRPDRLIGVILLGNNAANIVASSVATVIALQLFGESGVFASTALLTLVILIFSEVTPKTFAALHPERVALPLSFVLVPLLIVFYPIVAGVNFIANGMLRLIRVYPTDMTQDSLSEEELRTAVVEAGAMIPRRHQRMLVSILDLEKATVEDIMVPRNEIMGIDLSDDWDTIMTSLTASEHTRLPLFDGSIDELRGLIHLRSVLAKIAAGELDADALAALAHPPYFIPEGTPLNRQLLNFQNQKRRIGFVVDEYGDIQGLVTLEDILEEIVGEFTTDPADRFKHVYMDTDTSYLVDGGVNIRTLNRSMGWRLPTAGPKTLNGMILEYLESIPQPETRLEISGYQLEIAETRANAVKTVRIWPPATAKNQSK